MNKTRLPLFLLLLLGCITSCQNSKDAKNLYDTYQEGESNLTKIDETKKDTAKTTTYVRPQADIFDIPDYPGYAQSIRFSQANISQPYVALTFDDGPHRIHTVKILNILKKYNTKATFFVLGSNAKRYPQLLRRMVNEGHEVANHSWSHPFFTKLGAEELRKQLSDTNHIIEAATGVKVHSMRPPYGATNRRIDALMANQYGLTPIMWSVDPADWKRPGVGVVVNRVLSKARPGSVILLHDIHGTSAQAVEPIVKGLLVKGFKLITVKQLRAIESQAPKSSTNVQPSLQKAMQMGGY